MSERFWNFEEPNGEHETAYLRIDGAICGDGDGWFDNDIEPAAFRAALEQHPGDIVVYINSPGGDVFAASQIYTMLMEHNGTVTVRVEGVAASAASVIAMAGTTVEMAPTAYLMIHNASTIAWGDNREMERAAEMLAEINRGIREAYEIKTGLSEARLIKMMDNETWMSSRTALELGFADAIMGEEPEADPEPEKPGDIIANAIHGRTPKGTLFAARAAEKRLVSAIVEKHPKEPEPKPKPDNSLEIAREKLKLIAM